MSKSALKDSIHGVAFLVAITAYTCSLAAEGVYVYDGYDYTRAWGYTGNPTNGPAYIYGTPPSYGHYTGNYSEGHSNISPKPIGKVSVPSYFDAHPVVGIDQYSYYKCEAMTDMTIPYGVTYIDEAAFGGCSSMTNIMIPKSVNYIGDSAFSGCLNLMKIDIPSSVTYIGTNSFSGCRSLTEIIIPDSVSIIRDSAFANCTGLRQVILPRELTEIPAYAFSYCTNLSEIVIPETVTNIGQYAFRGCSNLKSIVLPQNITYIAEGTFAGCSSLHNITFPSGLKEIGAGAFIGDSLNDFVLPDSLERIGVGAFAGCLLLNDSGFITIPKTVESIDSGAFCETFIPGIIIQNGIIGEKAFANSYVQEVILTNSVVEIGAMAFRGCDQLSEISIPASVHFIGERAFYGLEESWYEDEYYYFINEYLQKYCGSCWYFEDRFRGCTSLTNVVLGGNTADAVRNENIYAYWVNIAGLPLVEGRQYLLGGLYIYDEAFGHCENLLDVTIGANVRIVSDSVFDGCHQLSNLKIEASPINLISATRRINSYDEDGLVVDLVTCITNIIPELNIGNRVFANCHSLARVSIPDRVKTIGDSAFYNCSTLINVTFKGNAPSMDSDVFADVASSCNAYVRKGSTGWGVEIPGTWNGLNICYLTPETEIDLANEAGEGAVELNADDLLDGVGVASGVTLMVNGESLDAAALAKKITIKPHEEGQSTSFFKVKTESIASGVSLAVVLDEDAVKPDETAAEIVAGANMAAIDSAAEGANVSVKLSGAKQGLYYGIAVAVDVAGLEKAAENVPLSRAGADGVTVPVVKPAGGAAFFKVVVSDRAR